MSRPRIFAAGALAALIVTLSLFALSSPPAQAHHEPAWEATLNPQAWTTSANARVLGCNSAFASTEPNRACSTTSTLSNDSFSSDGVTYTVRAFALFVEQGQSERKLSFILDTRPPYGVPFHITVGGRTVGLGSCMHSNNFLSYECNMGQEDLLTAGVRATVGLHATAPPTEAQRQLETRPASRSGANCIAPPAGSGVTEQMRTENAEVGYWHCHGDVFHKHPDWRARHPSPHSIRPTTTSTTATETTAADAQKHRATRAGVCGTPDEATGNNVEDDTDNGRWHCHGDLYHRHENWRAVHPTPAQTVRATGDRFVNTSVPRANTAEEKIVGFTDRWHWHGSPSAAGSIYHTHAGGGGSSHSHTSTTTLGPQTGDPPGKAAPTRATAAERADGLSGWHWHGDEMYHQHDAGGHPH